MEIPRKECVNALKGATSISTKIMGKYEMIVNVKCQCPERGDLHFYPCLWEPA